MNLKHVAAHISNSSDLNAAIAKTALDLGLSTGEISSLVHEVNHAVNQRKLAFGGDKAHAFSLASMDAVRAIMGHSKAAADDPRVAIAAKYIHKYEPEVVAVDSKVAQAYVFNMLEDILERAERDIPTDDEIARRINSDLDKFAHEYYTSGLDINGLREVVKKVAEEDTFNTDWEPILKAIEREHPVTSARPPHITDHNWVQVHMSRLGKSFSSYHMCVREPREMILSIRSSLSGLKEWPNVKLAAVVMNDASSKLTAATKNTVLDFLRKYVQQVASPVDINNRVMVGSNALQS